MGAFTSKSSKKKGPTINDTDRAVLSLKTQKRKLEDQEKLIGMRLERHGEVARQLVSEGRRERALLALKKKKLSEKQMMTLHTHIINLENMLLSIETSKAQSGAFAVLQAGNDALKQLQAQMRLEDVQKLMDETAEAAAYQKELAELLGQQLSGTDDAEVEDELAALEDVLQEEEALAMPKAPAVPQVPTAVQQPAGQEAARAKAPVQAERGGVEEEEEEEEERRPEPMLAS